MQMTTQSRLYDLISYGFHSLILGGVPTVFSSLKGDGSDAIYPARFGTLYGLQCLCAFRVYFGKNPSVPRHSTVSSERTIAASRQQLHLGGVVTVPATIFDEPNDNRWFVAVFGSEADSTTLECTVISRRVVG